jgi:DNA-binding response OmpR family regulator
LTTHKELKHILVVDDEEPIRTLLRDCFELEGYVVSEAGNGIELLACLEQHPVDLITLDLNLDGENGLDLARQTRTTRNIPIVMITGKGDTVDRIVGLELGADDYITKPFHVREVLARVRAVLRRYGGAADNADGATSTDRLDEQYAFGEYVLDIPRRELRSSAGGGCELTTGEFDMLVMFIKRPNRVLSRDNIMDLLKGREWSPLDRSIDSLVVRLRRKIEPDPASPTFIKTVRGVGYVFTGEVRKA